jgi:hypothetical protein
MFKVKDNPVAFPVHTVYGATMPVILGAPRLATTSPELRVAGIDAKAVVTPEVVEVVYAISPLSLL